MGSWGDQGDLEGIGLGCVVPQDMMLPLGVQGFGASWVTCRRAEFGCKKERIGGMLSR